MQKNYTTKTLSMKENERKSLEQKIQKTASKLKIAERQLPPSLKKKDACLVPNSISTKTFKKGLTLHNLLCDTNPCERQRSLIINKSNLSKMGKRTLSQEHINERPKITFYRNLSSTIVSSSAVELFEQSFSYGGGVHLANFDEICSNSTNHGTICSAESTPVKKVLCNEDKTAEELQRFNSIVQLGDGEEKGTPKRDELNESTETLVDDLNQQLKELKEKLTSANEKLGAFANQMDRTLNESFFGAENEQHGQLANNGTANGICNTLSNINKRLIGKSTQTMDSWHMGIEPRFRINKSAAQNKSSDLESKELMRKHIETLREHMKVRVFLLHAKRKGLPLTEKKNGQREFKALMDEFDEAKRKIKADFKRGNVDKGVLAKHYVEIGQLQRETRVLQSKLEQILAGKCATDASQFHNGSSMYNSFSIVSEKKMAMAPEVIEQQQQQQADDSVTEEVFTEGVVSSFKPSEKSLHSILSVRSNSMSVSGRDSMGKLRRDSASEALLKLRTMNCVPELRSPRMSKSSPNPFDMDEEVVVISAKSLARSSTLTQQTLEEVESIPEEHSSFGHIESMPKSPISAILENKMVAVEQIDEQQQTDDSALTQQTLAEVESIPEEHSSFDHTESMPKSSVSIVSENSEVIDQQQQRADDSVTEEVFTEGVVSSFKPSEKSLHSILSVRSNSMSVSGRDSMGKLRRDSASEALLKLRTMNCVPELRSPRMSKSPPRPLRSPRGSERFMAKFPSSSSREASFSEETSVRGEMLDELPNASQIGMLLDLSAASVEGTVSNKLDAAFNTKSIFIDKRNDSVEPNNGERVDSLSNLDVPEICSVGVKARAEKTSHVQLDTNRILLAQFVYDHLNIWPTEEMVMEADLEIIDGLRI